MTAATPRRRSENHPVLAGISLDTGVANAAGLDPFLNHDRLRTSQKGNGTESLEKVPTGKLTA